MQSAESASKLVNVAQLYRSVLMTKGLNPPGDSKEGEAAEQPPAEPGPEPCARYRSLFGESPSTTLKTKNRFR